jgi:hypothetical protein
VPLDRFVQNLLLKIIRAAASSLKRAGEPTSINIVLRRR